MRLIDADELLRQQSAVFSDLLCKAKTQKEVDAMSKIASLACYLARNAPTIDAVPVVLGGRRVDG